MLDADKIRKAHGPKFLDIPVPEWGDGDDDLLRVRRLTAQDWIELNERREGSDQYEFMASLIERCAIRQDGAAIFNEDNRDLLIDSPLILLRIGSEILRFNGLLRGEDAKKNDSPTAL